MNTILKVSESPSGKLECFVEGNGQSVWMFLWELDKDRIVGDTPMCSLPPLQTLAEFKANYKGEGFPPLVEAYTSQVAVIPDINKARATQPYR